MKARDGEEFPIQVISKLLTSFKFGKVNFFSGNFNSFWLSLSFPYPYLDKTKNFYSTNPLNNGNNDNDENNSSFSNEHHFVTLQPTPSLKKFSCFVLFNLCDIEEF